MRGFGMRCNLSRDLGRLQFLSGQESRLKNSNVALSIPLSWKTTICKQNVSKLPRSATLITTYCRILFANNLSFILQRSLFIGGKEQQELQHKAWAKRGGCMSL
ncbi:unnamed protein product [Sphagnum compactum]